MAAFYTLLYIAHPADAAAVANAEEDADRWPSIWLRHVGDQELVHLWSLLHGSAAGDTLMADLIFQGSEDGPFVMRVPPEFVELVAAVPPDRRSEIAEAWRRSEDLADWRPEELSAMLDELCEFARRAVESGEAVLQVAHL